MKDVLLEYVMKVDAYAPLPSASTAYIRKVLCVVKPNGETKDTIAECTETSEIQALTDAKVEKMLDAGMTSVLVLPVDDLTGLKTILEATDKKFFTILIDGAFDNSAVSAIDLGSFSGVVGWSTESKENAKAFTIKGSNVGFVDASANLSQNMYWAFGKLLSANNWKNQQYIEMPLSSGIDTINKAELHFEDAVSFVLTSEEYGNRLALFASNRRAIVAPYVFEELQNKLQSKAVQYISLNQPDYTESEASLLEDSLQAVIDGYVEQGLLTHGSIVVKLTDENFVLSAKIQVPEPKALWRIKAEMYQGEI